MLRSGLRWISRISALTGASPVHRDVENGAPGADAGEHLVESSLVHRQGLWCPLVSVDDRRDLAVAAQGPGGALAGTGTTCRFEEYSAVPWFGPYFSRTAS